MIADGDAWRLTQFRDACLKTGGLSFYVGEMFDALANDDLPAAQRCAVAYVHEWLADSRAQRRASFYKRHGGIPEQTRRSLQPEEMTE